MGLQRDRHDWSNLARTHGAVFHLRLNVITVMWLEQLLEVSQVTFIYRSSVSSCPFSRVCSLLSKRPLHPPSYSTGHLDALLGLFPPCSPSVQSLVFCPWWNSLCPHLLPRPCATTLNSPRTGFLPPSLHLFTFHSHSVLFKRLSLCFANSPSVIYLALSINASLNNVPFCSPPNLAHASFSAWNTPLYSITPFHSRSFLGKDLFIL